MGGANGIEWQGRLREDESERRGEDKKACCRHFTRVCRRGSQGWSSYHWTNPFSWPRQE